MLAEQNTGTAPQRAPLPSDGPSHTGYFEPRLANVGPITIIYPKNHLLGIPPEIRSRILKHVLAAIDNREREVLAANPVTGYESVPSVCRQIYYETSKGWNRGIVPHNRIGLLFEPKLANSDFYNFKSLIIEIPHNSPVRFFIEAALMFENLAAQLKELKIFGVGPDAFGVKTSSNIRTCGKTDTSLVPSQKLAINGQEYERRIVLVNKLQFLSKVRVLVLENLNYPILPAHVLKNKPHLERLHIGTDPRSMLHIEYKTRNRSLGLGNLIFTPTEEPPVKELAVTTNGTLTGSNILKKVASTLEILDWTIADVSFQNSRLNIDFFSEAAHVLRTMNSKSRKLHTLRLCIHGAVYETSYHFGNFIGAFKDCIPRFENLKTVELHIHSKSSWIAQEFIAALPESVERFYISDHFINRDLRALTALLSQKTDTPLQYQFPNTYAIGEDLSRKDFILLSLNKLGFVGYEYDFFPSKEQETDVMEFIKLNGRMLDKERNRHLRRSQGSYIPLVEPPVEDELEEAYLKREDDEVNKAPTYDEVQKNLTDLKNCGLEDNEYFGMEEIAQRAFKAEAVAKIGDLRERTYPAVFNIDAQFKASNHWLSK